MPSRNNYLNYRFRRDVNLPDTPPKYRARVKKYSYGYNMNCSASFARKRLKGKRGIASVEVTGHNTCKVICSSYRRYHLPFILDDAGLTEYMSSYVEQAEEKGGDFRKKVHCPDPHCQVSLREKKDHIRVQRKLKKIRAALKDLQFWRRSSYGMFESIAKILQNEEEAFFKLIERELKRFYAYMKELEDDYDYEYARKSILDSGFIKFDHSWSNKPNEKDVRRVNVWEIVNES